MMKPDAKKQMGGCISAAFVAGQPKLIAKLLRVYAEEEYSGNKSVQKSTLQAYADAILDEISALPQ